MASNGLHRRSDESSAHSEMTEIDDLPVSEYVESSHMTFKGSQRVYGPRWMHPLILTSVFLSTQMIWSTEAAYGSSIFLHMCPRLHVSLPNWRYAFRQYALAKINTYSLNSVSFSSFSWTFEGTDSNCLFGGSCVRTLSSATHWGTSRPF
jgi:hypothetical protein